MTLSTPPGSAIVTGAGSGINPALCNPPSSERRPRSSSNNNEQSPAHERCSFERMSASGPNSELCLLWLRRSLALLALPMYAIAKRGILALMQSLASLEAAGIRVTAVAPGIVKTPIWSQDKLALVDESVDEWVTKPYMQSRSTGCF
ncbi:uncharacterized protein BO97DRAFT_447404 [Aspergillus homomorphus CBS 101889]|uniref:NAD(P)-binding protein n=1 Tax=Aspergillus homomorphus (strain CBS 101889) TaxID=1450537 RepID=A0A395HK76_ASPHC|nr:hypothetical protein BO97DRAFT_447404 [Aspergillus homomorphus CBS 101889]RAL06664.1 hypothetical protein BO97DRAFT_447404 [Aspergillus homomorphus CBS 101889]